MTLEQLLQIRRTMDYMATSGPTDLFDMAKQDFLIKLKEYHETISRDHNKEQLELWVISEERRSEQLTVFNRTGSGNVNTGDNEKVRTGVTDGRGKSPKL